VSRVTGPSAPVSGTGFWIEVESSVDRHTVKVVGELDMAAAPRLREELERLRGSSLVLDLSAVPFIDSSGIRVLLAAERQAQEEQVQLSLRCSPEVQRALSLCGVDKHIPLETSSSVPAAP